MQMKGNDIGSSIRHLPGESSWTETKKIRSHGIAGDPFLPRELSIRVVVGTSAPELPCDVPASTAAFIPKSVSVTDSLETCKYFNPLILLGHDHVSTNF